MNKLIAAITAAALLAVPAEAGRLNLQAVPQDGVSTVKWMGATKVIQQRDRGMVSIVPRGMEQGRLAFEVEVHNLGAEAAVFGHSNVEVRTADQVLGIATPGKIEQDARRQATWTRIGVGLAMVALVGIAAAAASSAPSAHGFRPTYFYTPQPARRPAAAPAAAAASQAVPDATNVPSRHLYSGRIFVDRPKGSARQQDLRLLVNFNGEQYPFAFRVSGS